MGWMAPHTPAAGAVPAPRAGCASWSVRPARRARTTNQTSGAPYACGSPRLAAAFSVRRETAPGLPEGNLAAGKPVHARPRTAYTPHRSARPDPAPSIAAALCQLPSPGGARTSNMLSLAATGTARPRGAPSRARSDVKELGAPRERPQPCTLTYAFLGQPALRCNLCGAPPPPPPSLFKQMNGVGPWCTLPYKVPAASGPMTDLVSGAVHMSFAPVAKRGCRSRAPPGNSGLLALHRARKHCGVPAPARPTPWRRAVAPGFDVWTPGTRSSFTARPTPEGRSSTGFTPRLRKICAEPQAEGAARTNHPASRGA